MKVAIFSTKSYDRQFLSAVNDAAAVPHELHFFELPLDLQTVSLVVNYPAVCIFVNDQVDAAVLQQLSAQGTRYIALRCTGYNNVNLAVAHQLGLQVVRVPAYSPYAVAEYTVGLMLTLNRKIHRAYNRVREGNFALEGLLGFDLHGHTVGIVGTGKIGQVVAEILHGFGCRLLTYDISPNPNLTAIATHCESLEPLFAEADLLTLHCPLLPQTHHLINQGAIAKFKPGMILINTSRGGLIDTDAVIQGLKTHKIGALGIDVYEQESELFFEDRSETIIQDDQFERLLTFPNVIVTGHQAFFTQDALQNIAVTTLQNLTDLEQSGTCKNEI